MYSAKLAFVKRLINNLAPRLLKVVPRVQPRRPVSALTLRLFAFLRMALKLHPERFHVDGNFPKLLEASERTLVFIAEMDGHYAGWLGEARGQFPPGQAGDMAFYQWASQHGILKVKPAD